MMGKQHPICMPNDLNLNLGPKCLSYQEQVTFYHKIDCRWLVLQPVWCMVAVAGMCAGVTHWQSPNYFSWFPGNSSIPGILSEMLIAAFNMVGFSWQSSPVSTELEMVSAVA